MTSIVEVTSVGTPIDKSFMGQNGTDMVTCFEVPCHGIVGGVQKEFHAKVFGSKGADKITVGLTFNGAFSEYNGVQTYTMKKADNPDHFAKSNPAYAKPNAHSGSAMVSSESMELEALKLAVELMKGTCKDLKESDAVAKESVKIARSIFLPFLYAKTERHDKTESAGDRKKQNIAVIRQLINSNELSANVRAGNAGEGLLLSMYEQSGSDATKFVALVRQKFQLPDVPADSEYEDDIPF